MKIYKSNYRNHWLSPYIILEKVFFWREIDYDEPLIEKLSNFLNPFCVAWQKFLDFVHPQINYVKIDRWDTWSMDNTLADIILPMLKQLKESKHGSAHVDDEDVPEELRSTSAPAKENDYDIDDNHHKRWDYVIDEMIFAFEHKADDLWEQAYYSGEHDIMHVPCEWYEDGKPKLYSLERGPNHTHTVDFEGIQKVTKRMQNGFCLFGKYYQGLWD